MSSDKHSNVFDDLVQAHDSVDSSSKERLTINLTGAEVTKKQKEADKQLPLLQAETTWFHIFRHMIESGDLAKMGASAFAVYAAIKAYTNWSTGLSFPKIELLIEKTGLSRRQIFRSLEVLAEMEYLTIEKEGRVNKYTLREKIVISDNEGRPAAAAMWDYLPSTVEAARAELKNFLMSGDHKGAKIVNIESLTINVNVQNIAQGDGIQNILSADDNNPIKRAYLASRRHTTT